MVLKDFFLAQLDREAASTRKAIERVPDGHNSFKAHERSMEFGYLAALVAGMLGWIAFMIDRDELNLDAADSEGFRTKPLASKADLLASLDTAVKRPPRPCVYIRWTSGHIVGLQNWRQRSIAKSAQHHDLRRRLQPSRASSSPAHCLFAPPGVQGAGHLRTFRRRTLLGVPEGGKPVSNSHRLTC